jgi:hypothetical protein
VATLRAFALVDREWIVDERDVAKATHCIRLHRLVRVIAAARCDSSRRNSMLRALVGAMAEVCPRNVYDDPTTWARARRLDIIALGLVGDEATPPHGHELATAEILDWLGLHRLGPLASYGQARLLFERAWAIREEAFGPKHPQTAVSLINLARVLRAQGDIEGARALHKRALEIREAALGREHPDTARSLNYVARILRENGDLATARVNCERALAICEKAGSEDHDTATSLNNLARIFQAQGDRVSGDLCSSEHWRSGRKCAEVSTLIQISRVGTSRGCSSLLGRPSLHWHLDKQHSLSMTSC